MENVKEQYTITEKEFCEVQVAAFLDFLAEESKDGGKYTDNNKCLFDTLTEATGATPDSGLAKLLFCYVGGFLKGFELADKLHEVSE